MFDSPPALAQIGCCLLATLSLVLTSCDQPAPSGKPARTESPGPVSASLAVDAQQVRPSGRFEAIVELEIAPGWHIYAVDRPAAMASPTSARMEAADGIEPAGEWILPVAVPITAAPGELSFVYDGPVTLRCPMQVAAGAAAGEKTIRCVLSYQACDRLSCRPPAEIVLMTTVQVVR